MYLKTTVQRPIEFISSGQFISNEPWAHTRRVIPDFEMMIGVHKTFYITTRDKEYEVHPGDVLLILPEQVHAGTKLSDKDVSFFWFHFLPSGPYELIDQETMERETAAELMRPVSQSRLSNIYIPLFFTPRRIERTNILFQQMQHVAYSNYYTMQSADYLATSLLIELSEQTITGCFQSTQTQKNEGDRHFAEMVEWIRLHAMGDITVTDIANRFSYNRDYLSRIFKRKTGINLQEYIHLMKISKAKDMLVRSEKGVKEISNAVGIHDEKYFMRLFKKYEKITPTEYRTAFFRARFNND